MVQVVSRLPVTLGAGETWVPQYQGFSFFKVSSGFVAFSKSSDEKTLYGYLFTTNSGGVQFSQKWTAFTLSTAIYFSGASVIPGTDNIVAWYAAYPSTGGLVTLAPGVTKSGPDTVRQLHVGCRVGSSVATFANNDASGYSFGGEGVCASFTLGSPGSSGTSIPVSAWTPDWRQFGGSGAYLPYEGVRIRSAVATTDGTSIWVTLERPYSDTDSRRGWWLQRISITGVVLEEYAGSTLRVTFDNGPYDSNWFNNNNVASIGDLMETPAGPIVWDFGFQGNQMNRRLLRLSPGAVSELPTLGAWRSVSNPNTGQTTNFPGGFANQRRLTHAEHNAAWAQESFATGSRVAMISRLKIAFYTYNGTTWDAVDVFGGWPRLLDDYEWSPGAGRPGSGSYPGRSEYDVSIEPVGVGLVSSGDAVALVQRYDPYTGVPSSYIVRARPEVRTNPALVVPRTGPSRCFTVEANYDSVTWGSSGNQQAFAAAPINADDAPAFLTKPGYYPFATQQNAIYSATGLTVWTPSFTGISSSANSGWNTQLNSTSYSYGLPKGWHVVVGGIQSWARTYLFGSYNDLLDLSNDPNGCLVTVGTSSDGHPMWTLRWDDYYHPISGGRSNHYIPENHEQPGLFIGLIQRITLRPTTVPQFSDCQFHFELRADTASGNAASVSLSRINKNSDQESLGIFVSDTAPESGDAPWTEFEVDLDCDSIPILDRIEIVKSGDDSAHIRNVWITNGSETTSVTPWAWVQTPNGLNDVSVQPPNPPIGSFENLFISGSYIHPTDGYQEGYLSTASSATSITDVFTFSLDFFPAGSTVLTMNVTYSHDGINEVVLTWADTRDYGQYPRKYPYTADVQDGILGSWYSTVELSDNAPNASTTLYYTITHPSLPNGGSFSLRAHYPSGTPGVVGAQMTYSGVYGTVTNHTATVGITFTSDVGAAAIGSYALVSGPTVINLWLSEQGQVILNDGGTLPGSAYYAEQLSESTTIFGVTQIYASDLFGDFEPPNARYVRRNGVELVNNIGAIFTGSDAPGGTFSLEIHDSRAGGTNFMYGVVDPTTFETLTDGYGAAGSYGSPYNGNLVTNGIWPGNIEIVPSSFSNQYSMRDLTVVSQDPLTWYFGSSGPPPPLRQRHRDDGLGTDTRQEKGYGSSQQMSLRRGGRVYY